MSYLEVDVPDEEQRKGCSTEVEMFWDACGPSCKIQ